MMVFLGTIRTSFFKTNDTERLHELAQSLDVNGSLELMYVTGIDGTKKYALGGHGLFGSQLVNMVCHHSEEMEIQAVYEALQPLLPDGEAVLAVYMGDEKNLGTIALSSIITNKTIETMDVWEACSEKAAADLGIENFDVEK